MPVSAEGQATASSVRGPGPAALSSTDALAQLSPTEGARAMLGGSAVRGELRVVDDYDDRALTLPGNPPGTLAHNNQRNETRYGGRNVTITLDEVLDPDATVIVLPASPEGYRAAAASTGGYRLTTVNDLVLETSHVFGPGTVPRPPQYYEYAVSDCLELAFDGPGSVRFEGDVAIYAWGVQLTYSDDDTFVTIRTGATANQVIGGRDEVQETHAVFAVGNFQSASLTMRGNGVRLFGAFSATDATSIYSDAKGEVATEGGEARMAGGDVTVRGADADWAFGDGAIAVRFSSAAQSVSGENVQVVQPAITHRDWFWPVAFGILAAILLFAVLAAPNVLGGRSEGGITFLERRANGHNQLRARAEQWGRHGIAAFFAGRAAACDRDDPRHPMNAGMHWLLAGRPRRALEWQVAAATLFRLSPDKDDEALNAYQAARSASRLGDVPQALHWLRTAIEAIPALAVEAARESDFARIAQEADFRSLLGPGDM